MDGQKTQGQPAKPVVKRGQRYLPAHKYLPVELFDKSRDNKKKKTNAAQNSCPPRQVIAQYYGHLVILSYFPKNTKNLKVQNIANWLFLW